MDLATFLIQCLNALQYGLLLFLVASGLTLIFGIMGVINLAHGSFYMIGAYMAYALAPVVGSTFGGGFFATLFVGLVLSVILGYVLEWVFFQSSHVGEFIGQRFGGFVELMHLDTAAFNLGVHDSEGPHISDVLASVDVSGVLTSLETWMGLLAAAVMGYATIRIRRYRDDS